jgi:single-strand DNA-binding protein
MLNRVVLIGRLCADPELKYTPSGIAVATFRIAVGRIPNAQGERETDFIPIVAWRHSAEFAANYLTKGRLVAVDGKLQIRSWVAQDGSRRTIAEVVADHLEGLDRAKERTEAAPAPGAEEPGTYGPGGMSSGGDFEDPFADE